MDIAIVGAGASGMAAALQAAWRGAAVTLFEQNQSVGRKLLVTGSGRCNLTNANARQERYACADSDWMGALLERFSVADVLAMFREIGVPTYPTSDGWYYPVSESAQTVVDAFSSALSQAGVKMRTSTHVTGIHSQTGGFDLQFVRDDRKESQSFKRVVLSAGGKAYPTLGSRGELFPELEQLGHSVLPKRPALAPVLAELGDLSSLQGIRLDASVSLWDASECLGVTTGNLIFTQWGLNGPAVMDLSHLISARPGRPLSIHLDLLAPHAAAFDELLVRKRGTALPVKVLLEAILPPKAAAVYLSAERVPADTPLDQVEGKALERVLERLRNTRFSVQGVRGFEYCQVSAGGTPVNEVDPRTLESLRLQGLYLPGETLDVVGPCGGYNLQYAFSSGAIAGQSAAG